MVALAMLLALGLDWVWRPRENMRPLWAGILLGALLLFKINIGIFLCIGVALAIGLHMKGWTRIVFCGLPLLASAVFGIAVLFITPFRSEVYRSGIPGVAGSHRGAYHSAGRSAGAPASRASLVGHRRVWVRLPGSSPHAVDGNDP
jgi:hypothetical protein